MNFPSPTPRQGRILWLSLTILAIGIIIALVGLLTVGLAWVAKQLSPVLIPLAVATILAYLLDPLVDYLHHRKNIPRTWAILLVFLLAVVLVLALAATFVPQLVMEINQLINNLSDPAYRDSMNERFHKWIEGYTSSDQGKERIQMVKRIWDEHGASLRDWLAQAAPEASAWVFSKFGKVASWLGLLVGFALVPVYVFYFLLEKRGIAKNWTDYLPIQEPGLKDELVFFLKSVNDAMITFFRGQVLVAMCVGILTAIGFVAIGLNYGLLLGVMAGILGIIPYLGVMMSFIPAVILGIVQFGDWRVALVVVVFIAVQSLEGLVISPKIMGDRVGMHPLTIIIAVMVGTTLMGGIVGGILAIPLTAVLRALMFRYIWKRKQALERESGQGSEAPA